MQYFHSITDITKIKAAPNESSLRYLCGLVQEAKECKRILNAQEREVMDMAIASRDAETLEKALGYR